MMQEKDNHIKCQMIQNVETCTTNIGECVMVTVISIVSHYIVEQSWKEW